MYSWEMEKGCKHLFSPFFFGNTPQLDSGFLKIGFSVEAETNQHIFRHFFIKSLLINLEFFIDLLLIYCRITHWSSENIDSELFSSSKYWHIIKKSYWLTVSPTTLSEKSLNIAKFQACGKHKFSKTLIFTSKFKFHHHQQMLSVIFLEMISLLYPFSRKCVPTTQVWITIVFLSETAQTFSDKTHKS